jgi:hypothetical protein
LTVSIAVALVIVLLRVTEAGLNEQVTVEDEGLQVRAMFPLNPVTEAIVMVDVPEPPANTFMLEPEVSV